MRSKGGKTVKYSKVMYKVVLHIMGFDPKVTYPSLLLN